MPIPREQSSNRKSSIADRYLKAIDNTDASLSNLNPVSPHNQYHKDAHLSMSGTASLSSSSRTPTPVRSQSRGPWQSRGLASSPETPMDPSQSSLTRIRLFPATTPFNQTEEDVSTEGSSLTPRTTETPSTAPEHSSPDTRVSRIGLHDLSESSRGWRKRLEGPARGKKVFTAKNVNDATWIKKKGSPRRLGASPRTIPENLPPQSLTAIAYREQSKSDPSTAPTEIMMNLSSANTRSHHKSDFGGAATELATNSFTDRKKVRRDTVRAERASYETSGVNADGNDCDAVDESIEYPLHQHMMDRRQTSEIIQTVEAPQVELQPGRLRRHVHNFGYNFVGASDSSFQSKSLTSSVGVETGGRAVDKTPVALRRVLEHNSQGKGSLWRNDNREPVDGSGDDAQTSAVAQQHEAVDSRLQNVDGLQLAGNKVELELRDQSFLARNRSGVLLNGHDDRTEPESPASSGWTPVVLSSTGKGQEDFSNAMTHADKAAVQLLFSPDRVNEQVVDMVEFGPPRINRTSMIEDDLHTSTMVSNSDNGTRAESGAADPVRVHLETYRDSYTRADARAPETSTIRPGVIDPANKNGNFISTRGQQSSLVRNRISAFNKTEGTKTSDVHNSFDAFKDSRCSSQSGTNPSADRIETVATTIGTHDALKNSKAESALDLKFVDEDAGRHSRQHHGLIAPLNSAHMSESANIHFSLEVRSEKSYPYSNSSNMTAQQKVAVTIPREAIPVKSLPSGNQVSTNVQNDVNIDEAPTISDCVLGIGIPVKSVPKRCMLDQESRVENKRPLPVVGSVSKMRSIYESKRQAVEVDRDDDTGTVESLDVKTIRSFFEDTPDKQLKADVENAVTKIRSLFERGSSQPPKGRTQPVVRNLEIKCSRSDMKVLEPGRQPATRTYTATQDSVIVSNQAFRGSKSFNDVSKSDQAISTRRPSVADRMNEMKPSTRYPEVKSAACRTELSSFQKSTHSLKGGVIGGNRNASENLDATAKVTKGCEQQLLKNASSVSQDNVISAPTPTMREQFNRNGQKERVVTGGSKMRIKAASSTGHPNTISIAAPSVSDQFALTQQKETASDNNPPMSKCSPLVNEQQGLVDSRWVSPRPVTRDLSDRDSRGYQSTLQGVVVRKPIKPDSKRIVRETRTDSEGYDDGVTLDLSIADVSCLTNPTFLHSKEDASLDGASSRLSKDIEVTDGRGPSEASSSQTSEAAAPLLALTMRTKFTNSSDDFGYFSQRSFGDRLSLDPQAKWIALNTPPEDNVVEGTEQNGEPSDPAWDLRNIKARFTERQARKAAKESAQTRDGHTWRRPLSEEATADRWEPFESVQFPDVPAAPKLTKDMVGHKIVPRPVDCVTEVLGAVDRDREHAGSPGKTRLSGYRQKVIHNSDNTSLRAPLDQPNMGSSKLKASNSTMNQSQVSTQVSQDPSKRIPCHPESSSHHKALMSKLLSLREARLRRNTVFSGKTSNFGPPRQRGTAEGLPFQKFSAVGAQHLSSDLGPRFDDEDQSASTLSSTRFGGRKFIDCLDVD